MNDDSSAEMSTVLNATDVTEALTLTMMVTVNTIGDYTNTNLSYNLWHNPKYKYRFSRCPEGTAGSRTMSELEGLQLNVNQP